METIAYFIITILCIWSGVFLLMNYIDICAEQVKDKMEELKNTTMINPNDPAFPFAWEGKETEDGKEISIVTHKQSGLSIRAELAAKAMQGILAGLEDWYEEETDGRNSVAEWSVKYADALIAELNKTT